MIGTATVIRGNALHLPLPDNSVDLICTSPPYFALRSYQDSGSHYQGQIGSEATPAEFLEALLAATREMVRVLKPSGSLFVNLGDKYAGIANQRERRSTQSKFAGTGTIDDRPKHTPQNVSFGQIRDKSLMGIPWRYAIACIDQLGLILRAEIIWAKPNGLPESVTDRVRRSHEQWFHFTRQPRYFAAVDEIREAQTSIGRPQGRSNGRDHRVEDSNGATQLSHLDTLSLNPLGKLPGSVWTVPTQPLEVPPELGVDHFAAYPMEWPRRIIQGWTPIGICVECGDGRRPLSTVEYVRSQNDYPGRTDRNPDNNRDNTALPFGSGASRLTTITGYSCGCPTPTAPTRPSVCLDPFGGTGTTALVAKALGRTGISIDLSADYCRLAEWRCNNPQQLAQALQVEKPDVIPDGQLSLFEDGPEPLPVNRFHVNPRGRDCAACGYRSHYANIANCEKCGAPRKEPV